MRLDQGRETGPDGVDDTVQVDVEDVIERRLAARAYRLDRRRDARVRDHHVDPTEHRDRVLDRGVEHGPVGHVDSDADRTVAEAPRLRPGRDLVHVGDDDDALHRRAVAAPRRGRCRARRRHEHDFALDLHTR